ncbi:hypothetical protein Gotur_009597 [Gossypium turneri]
MTSSLLQLAVVSRPWRLGVATNVATQHPYSVFGWGECMRIPSMYYAPSAPITHFASFPFFSSVFCSRPQHSDSPTLPCTGETDFQRYFRCSLKIDFPFLIAGSCSLHSFPISLVTELRPKAVISSPKALKSPEAQASNPGITIIQLPY